ncbi:hypothetical protein AB0J30_24265 [Streptomyces microflavus]|uniref:hypothetical protein n=1 Tax=Streptomyces microflavus TaxID=1919 RepID=UPI0034452887
MASIRTARVLAAVAALPLTIALCGGVALADNGSFANDGSNAAVATIGGNNTGNSSTTQQQAVGSGASNQNTSAQVSGSAFTAIDQSDHSVDVNFTPFFW